MLAGFDPTYPSHYVHYITGHLNLVYFLISLEFQRILRVTYISFPNPQPRCIETFIHYRTNLANADL